MFVDILDKVCLRDSSEAHLTLRGTQGLDQGHGEGIKGEKSGTEVEMEMEKGNDMNPVKELLKDSSFPACPCGTGSLGLGDFLGLLSIEGMRK